MLDQSHSCVVIGSGPSGVHAALTLLKKGKKVLMIDVGHKEKDFGYPGISFNELKMKLDDPYHYFLGDGLKGILDHHDGDVFDYPPSRNFMMRGHENPYHFDLENFDPILSLNQGGLGVGWGANCARFDNEDLASFPFSASELDPYYEEINQRIKISAPNQDDLSDYLGSFDGYPPLKLNQHEQKLLNIYQTKKGKISSNFKLGYSRMAVDHDQNSPHQCNYCVRCLWGCPVGAIYNPQQTLKDCFKYTQFEYREGYFVHSLISENGQIRGVKAHNLKNNLDEKILGEKFFLGCGAIGSGTVFLKTLSQDSRFSEEYKANGLSTLGLMDSKVVKIPYIFREQIGLKKNERDFQFNKLAVGYLAKKSSYPSYVHGELLTLSSLLYHPLIERLPFGSLISSKVFKLLQSALGVVTYFFPDKLNSKNRICFSNNQVKLSYEDENSDKKEMISEVINQTVKTLFKLKCLVWPKQILTPVNGSGIHYAGTIPMKTENNFLSVNSYGRTYAYENLYVVDGSSFPSLPSKSITLSLMAHAVRVATYAC